MRLLLIIPMLLVSVNAQALELHKRIDAYLQNTNQAKAQSIKTAVLARVSESGKWDAEKKNVDIDYGLGTKNDQNAYWIKATYLFNNDTKAQQVFDYIKNNMPTGVTGKVSIHSCPVEGSIVAGWQGCKQDQRAGYEEVNF